MLFYYIFIICYNAFIITLHDLFIDETMETQILSAGGPAPCPLTD